MNKVDFPIGVELPLRGGGVAVLYEFVKGQWFGRRYSPAVGWMPETWYPDGSVIPGDKAHSQDILPPKRKAWVVWYPKRPGREESVQVLGSWAQAVARADCHGGTVQEITEP